MFIFTQNLFKQLRRIVLPKTAPLIENFEENVKKFIPEVYCTICNIHRLHTVEYGGVELELRKKIFYYIVVSKIRIK